MDKVAKAKRQEVQLGDGAGRLRVHARLGEFLGLVVEREIPDGRPTADGVTGPSTTPFGYVLAESGHCARAVERTPGRNSVTMASTGRASKFERADRAQLFFMAFLPKKRWIEK
jgi:hypothetical protein